MTEPIPTIRPEWTLVIDQLVRVELHLYRWRAKTRSQFVDFGLNAADFHTYTAGTRRLLPQEIEQELETLERIARTLHEKWSYQTGFGRLMPKDKYEDFKAWIETKPLAELRRFVHNRVKTTPDTWRAVSLKERWLALGSQIAQTRDQIVDTMVEAYRPSAIVRWRIENGLPKDSDVIPPDEWLDDVLATMVARIPTASDIRNTFALHIVPAFVEAPDEAVKATKLEAIDQQQREVERRLAELDRNRIETQKQLEWNRVNTEREQQRLVLQAERERLQREERITREVMEHEKRLKEERITQTLDDIAGQLHTLVYQAMVDGLTMIRAKGKLHPRYVGRVRGLVEQVRDLNFTDNAALAAACSSLERAIEDNAASVDAAPHMRDLLTDVGISMKADLVNAQIPTRSARDLNIPDHPPEHLVRRARGLDADMPDLFAAGEQQAAPAPFQRKARRLDELATAV